MTTTRITILAAMVLLICGPAHAQTTINKHVTWNVDALVGHVAGPYSLNFQLVDGAGSGNGNAVVTLSNAPFASFSLNNTSFFQSNSPAFVPVAGVPVEFDLEFTSTSADSPTPDTFSFAVLDSTGFEIPTSGPADASATVDFTGSGLQVSTFSGDTSRTPNAGGPAIALAAPVFTDFGEASAVPEPGSWVLFLCAGIVTLPHLTRRATRGLRNRRSTVRQNDATRARPRSWKAGSVVLVAVGLCSIALVGLGKAVAAAPVTPWSVCRDYNCWYVIQSFSSPMALEIESQDFETGVFHGRMNGVDITGTIVGSNLAWDVRFGDLVHHFYGQVGATGKLSGSLSYNNGHGEWFGLWGPTVQSALRASPGLTMQPNPIAGGQAGVGTISLDHSVSGSGLVVSLSSSDSSVNVPPSVVIAPNDAAWATFPVTTSSVGTPVTATLTAAYDDGSGHVEVTTEVVVLPGAIDATASYQISRGGLRKSQGTGRWGQTVTVKNTSGTTVAGPISLVLDNLSLNATLFNKSGDTAHSLPIGSPYRTSPVTLAPGASASFTLEFTNPSNSFIDYSVRVLAGAGAR